MKSHFGKVGRITAIAVLVAASLPFAMPPAYAHDFRHGPITIAHPFVRVDPACSAPTTSGYVMLLINQGKQADRLVAAELDGGRRGKLMAASKQPPKALAEVTAIDLPAGADTALMLPAHAIEFPLPSKDIQPGSAIKGTLKFERAGTARISFMVEVASGGKGCAPAQGAAKPEPRPDSMHHHKHP